MTKICRSAASAAALTAFLLLSPLGSLMAPAQARAERFSHKFHEEQGAGECRQCHLPGAASIIPPRSACLSCHQPKDLVDTPFGPTRTHTAFWLRQHGKESSAPGAQCRSCHASSSCLDCHAGGEIGVDLRRQAGKVSVPPRAHAAGFRILHPLKAEGNGKEACGQCHKASFCSDCHQKSVPPPRSASASHRRSWLQIEAGMGGPVHRTFTNDQCQDCHPGGALASRDWSAGHAQEARRNLSSCRGCHPDGEECSSCHSAKSGLKVSPHPANWRKIQKKFRQESPGVCDKCHAAGSI